MPMRSGYADYVFVVTSGENMSIHAGANIAMALERFQNRGYAKLGGFILNRRNVQEKKKKCRNWQKISIVVLLGTSPEASL